MQSNINQDFLCPITGKIIAEPVLSHDGLLYEKEALKEVFGEMLDDELQPVSLKPFEKMIRSFMDANPDFFFSEEFYTPSSWTTQLADEIRKDDQAAVKASLDRHPGLLIRQLEAQYTALHIASQFGSEAMTDFLVKLLLNCKHLHKFPKSSPQGYQPKNLSRLLSKAVESKAINDIDFYIRFGADVNFINSKARGLVHEAVHMQDLNLVKKLIALGANFTNKDGSGFSPLLIAMKNRATEICDYLSERGAKLDNYTDEDLQVLLNSEKPGISPEKHGINSEKHGKQGANEKPGIISEKQPPQEPKFEKKKLSKEKAMAKPKENQPSAQKIEKAPEKAASIHAAFDSELLEILRSDDVDKIDKHLSSEPGKYNKKFPNGKSLTHICAELGLMKLVRALKEKSPVFNFNELDNELNTPLHIAAGLGNINMIKELLQNGANIFFQNLRLDTPVSVAIKGGRADLAKLMLEFEGNNGKALQKKFEIQENKIEKKENEIRNLKSELENLRKRVDNLNQNVQRIESERKNKPAEILPAEQIRRKIKLDLSAQPFQVDAVEPLPFSRTSSNQSQAPALLNPAIKKKQPKPENHEKKDKTELRYDDHLSKRHIYKLMKMGSCKLHKLYSGQKCSFSPVHFHKCCDNRNPILLLAKTAECIYGVFSTAHFETVQGQKRIWGSEDSFAFIAQNKTVGPIHRDKLFSTVSEGLLTGPKMIFGEIEFNSTDVSFSFEGSHMITNFSPAGRGHLISYPLINYEVYFVKKEKNN